MKEEIVSQQRAYELICTLGADSTKNNALFARDWLKTGSWYMNSTLFLNDSSSLYRDGLGHLIHLTRG